jgi:homoserine kinase
MHQSVRARAYASIGNVGHGFDVFGLCVDAGHDEVEVSRGGSGLELTLAGRGADEIPTDPARNTAGRAIMAVRERHAIADPLRVRVIKDTRSGSGLGSSAASAAAAVVAADALLGLSLPRPELVLLAAEGERASAGAAHTDNVAASIYGGFVIFDSGSPARAVHVSPPATLRFVLALPSIRINTKDARGVLPSSVSVAAYSRGCARAAMSALLLERGDLAGFGEQIEGSVFEAARITLLPGFAAVCAAARKAGAYGCIMSGAGPAVAAVADMTCDTAGIAAAMRGAFATAGVESETFVASAGPAASVIEARG